VPTSNLHRLVSLELNLLQKERKKVRTVEFKNVFPLAVPNFGHPCTGKSIISRLIAKINDYLQYSIIFPCAIKKL